MISRKALVVGFVGLVFVAGGTASVLESFGTITGTADVKSALEFVEVQATNSDEYVLLENRADEPIDVSRINISDGGGSSDSLVSTNSSDSLGPDQYLLIVTENMQVDSYSGSKEFIKASTQDGGITGGLANGGETLTAWIDDTGVKSLSYTGSCSSSQAEKADGSCVDATFEVSSK